MDDLLQVAHEEITMLNEQREYRELMEYEYGWHEPLVWVNGKEGTVPVSLLTEEDHKAGITKFVTRSERERARPEMIPCRGCGQTPFECGAYEEHLKMVDGEVEGWAAVIVEHAKKCPDCGNFC